MVMQNLFKKYPKLFFVLGFLLFIGVFLIIMVTGGKKPLLLIIAYLIIFYEGLRWLITRTELSEQELFIMTFLALPFLWGISAALFFFTAVGTIALPLTPELRLSLIGSHILYISGWISILNKIQATIIRGSYKLQKSGTLAIVLVLIVIGQITLFYYIPDTNKYLPPRSFAQFHSNPLFIVIEIFCLITAITIFIGSFSKKRGFLLTSIALVLFLLFTIFTEMGRLTFNRMRYDFVFLGPVLLSFGLSFEIIAREAISRIKGKGIAQYFLYLL